MTFSSELFGTMKNRKFVIGLIALVVANVIWGLSFDDSLDDEMRITIIATGFENDSPNLLDGAPKAAAKPAPADELELPFQQRPQPQAPVQPKTQPRNDSYSKEYDALLQMLRGQQ